MRYEHDMEENCNLRQYKFKCIILLCIAVCLVFVQHNDKHIECNINMIEIAILMTLDVFKIDVLNKI